MKRWLARSTRLVAAGVRNLLEPAPDPQTLHAHPGELLAHMREARTGIVAAQEQLGASIKLRAARIEELHQHAAQELAIGREDRARAALHSRIIMQEEQATALQRMAQLDTQARQIASAEQRLFEIISAAADRQRVAAACLEANEARIRARNALDTLAGGISKLDLTLGIAEEQAADAAALAAALEHIARHSAGGDYLRQQTDALQRAEAVEEDLRALRL
jgi:phage shock protein A